MFNMGIGRLKEILSGIPGKRVAVVGDFFLDRLLDIDRSLDEPSLETGLTAYQVVRARLSPGAAGTVTNNLAALGAGEVLAIGAIGDDGEGYELLRKLRGTGVDTGSLLQDGALFTPTYTKPMFNGTEETNRLDTRNRGAFPAGLEARLIGRVRAAASRVDAIVALDQVVERNTGVVTDAMRSALSEIGRERPGLIVYADSRANIRLFRDIIVKCNHREALESGGAGGAGAAAAAGGGEPDYGLLRDCALRMSGAAGRSVFVTWGENGVVAAGGGEADLVPAVKAEGPVDICGAGDAATAGIVCSLCCGASRPEAAFIGNLAAGVTVRKIGVTGTASRGEILDLYLNGCLNSAT